MLFQHRPMMIDGGKRFRRDEKINSPRTTKITLMTHTVSQAVVGRKGRIRAYRTAGVPDRTSSFDRVAISLKEGLRTKCADRDLIPLKYFASLPRCS